MLLSAFVKPSYFNPIRNFSRGKTEAHDFSHGIIWFQLKYLKICFIINNIHVMTFMKTYPCERLAW